MASDEDEAVELEEVEAAEVVRWARKVWRFVEGGRFVMMIRVDLSKYVRR